jgi:hypothetical protein
MQMVLLASNYDKSRFLKADDFDGDRKFRIKSVTEELVGAGAEKEKKLVVWFTNDECGLVLNRVNNRTLRAAFGDDTAGWINKIIIVFSMMVEMRGKMVPGLRVRIPPPKDGSPTVAAKPKPSGNGQNAVAPSRRMNRNLPTIHRQRSRKRPLSMISTTTSRSSQRK